MNANFPTGETMNEGSDVPPMMDSAPAQATTTVQIPVSALAMPDEGEQMQAPKEGDQVDYQVTGKVTAVNGDMATVQVTAINGNEIESPAEDAGEGPGTETLESLQDSANQMGAMG